MPKVSSSFKFNNDYLGKENTPTSFFNKSIDYHLHQIQTNFTNMKIVDQSIIRNSHLTTDDYEMSSSFNMKRHYSIDWSCILDDCEEDETRASSINYENDIPNITKSEEITGKIIANAIESEKTLIRIFEINPKLIPNERNGIVLYNKMKEYKERFDRELFFLHCRVNGLGLGCNNMNGSMNETFDDYSMEMLIDSNTLNDFFDDDMVID